MTLGSLQRIVLFSRPGIVGAMPVPDHLVGGCQCGACRYETTAAPAFGYVCHCHSCRKATGSAFSASIMVAEDALTATGPITTWYRPEAEGPPVEARFCTECGVRLFHHAVPRNGAVRVKLGTLDDSDWFAPAAEFFTKRRFDWVHVSGEPVQCLEQATDYEALGAAWAKLFPADGP
jgi:hypothetical protein